MPDSHWITPTTPWSRSKKHAYSTRFRMPFDRGVRSHGCRLSIPTKSCKRSYALRTRTIVFVLMVPVSLPKDTRWQIEPHTVAKHQILRKYLDAWFPILSSSNQRWSTSTGLPALASTRAGARLPHHRARSSKESLREYQGRARLLVYRRGRRPGSTPRKSHRRDATPAHRRQHCEGHVR